MERYEKCHFKESWFTGKFSRIYHARDTLLDESVLVKRVSYWWEEDNAPRIVRETQREVSILKELSNHENIVQLKNCIDDADDQQMYLIFESLTVCLKSKLDSEAYIMHNYPTYKRKALSSERVKRIMHQICSGLVFCHEKHILHLDLKPHNILFSSKHVDAPLKICGFDYSRSVHNDCDRDDDEVVTLWYRSPELLLGSTTFAASIDAWSLGCLFAEIIMLRPVFTGRNQIDQLFHIFRQCGTPNDSLWPGVTSLAYWNAAFPKWYPSEFHRDIRENVDPLGLELLEMLLVCNPKERISSRDALDHPYFD
mmetsp:Transcript_40067/g.84128  ORF Transcript_40067/g.84128 Transcript_40067/m.84128 type:complete len:311 (-) Transcript_40067:155-1087(-)